MKCVRCGSDIHGGSEELCGKCKAEEIGDIPSGVFLNQISSGTNRPPTNIPLQALGGKELSRAKLKDVLIGIGILVILTLITGLLLLLLFR